MRTFFYTKMHLAFKIKEKVVIWFADNIEPFYNGIFPIWSKIQSELK